MQNATDKSSGELCLCEGRLGGEKGEGRGAAVAGGRVTSSSSWLRLKHHLRADMACREPLQGKGEGAVEKEEGDRGKQGVGRPKREGDSA